MTTYTMSNRADQKLQIGDESNARLIAGTGAKCSLVAGNGDFLYLQLGTGANSYAQCGHGHHNTLVAGCGAGDTLVGGNGGCTFVGADRANHLYRGGSGNDLFALGQLGANLTIQGGGGSDTIEFTKQDSSHAQVFRDTGNRITQVTFTDIARTVYVKDIEVLHFSDGKMIT